MPRIPTQPSRGSGSSPRHHPACSEATRGLSRPASVRRPDAPALRCARRMTPCSSAMPLARPGMRRPSELAPDRRPASSRAAVIIGSFRPRRLQSRAATSSPEPGLFAKLTRLSTLLSSPSRPDAWQPPRRGPPQSDQRRLITTAVRLQPERPEASRLITGPDTPGARASRRSCVARVVAENRWSAGPDRPPRGRLLYTATALDEHDPTNPSTRECSARSARGRHRTSFAPRGRTFHVEQSSAARWPAPRRFDAVIGGPGVAIAAAAVISTGRLHDPALAGFLLHVSLSSPPL